MTQSLRAKQWRLILVAAITAIALAGGYAVWSAGHAPGAVQKLDAAEYADAVAGKWLRDNSGTNCFESAIFDYYVTPAFYKAVDGAAAVDAWLTPDSASAFVGDIKQASRQGARLGLNDGAVTQGGTDAFATWTDSAGPVVFHYEGGTTPSGRSYWILVSVERQAGSCSAGSQ